MRRKLLQFRIGSENEIDIKKINRWSSQIGIIIIKPMKLNQNNNMVQKVHKSVRYMLSEARQILKIKHQIPVNQKRKSQYLEQLPPLHFHHISTNTLKHTSVSPRKQYGRYENNQKSQRLISQRNKVLRSHKSLNLDDQQKESQSKSILFSSILNKDQQQLINTKHRKIKNRKTISENHIILLPEKERFNTQSYFTIPDDSVSEKYKKISAISSHQKNTIDKHSVLNFLQKSKKNRLLLPSIKREQAKAKRKKCKAMNFYEPWATNEDNDEYFVENTIQ